VFICFRFCSNWHSWWQEWGQKATFRQRWRCFLRHGCFIFCGTETSGYWNCWQNVILRKEAAVLVRW